jgi:hypothetical protein
LNYCKFESKLVLLVICFLSLVNLCIGQDTLWVRRFDLGYHEAANGIACQGNNIVVVGNHYDTLLNSNWLIVKYNQLGETLWTRTFGTDFEDYPTDASFDSENNILVAGYSGAFLNNKLNFLNSKVMEKLPALIKFLPNQDDTIFAITIKYDSLGEIKWKKTEANKQAVGVTVDNEGNSYVSGIAFTSYDYDFWLIKYNPFGDSVWTRTLDFALLDAGYRVTTDAEGNIIQSGFSGDGYSFDCYVIKYSPGGDTIWTRRFDLNSFDLGINVATDLENNIILVGLTGTEPYYDILVIKYNTEGTLIWSRTFDRATDDEAIGVACDTNNNIFITGVTGILDYYDYLTIKYNPAGDTIWTAIYDNGYDDVGQDITCDDEGNPIVTGASIGPGYYDFLTIKYQSGLGIQEPFTQSALPISKIIPDHSVIGSNLIFYAPFSGYFDLELYDCNGKRERKIHQGFLNQGAHRLSINDLACGVHFIKVDFPKGKSTIQKLVIIK